MKNPHVMIKPTMLHIMLHPQAPSDAGSDTKKRSHSFVRPVIRSDVPNTQLTSIAKRPRNVAKRKNGKGVQKKIFEN